MSHQGSPVVYYHRFIILFTQTIKFKEALKYSKSVKTLKKANTKKQRKHFKSYIIQYLEKYSSTVQRLAWSEQSRRVTDWRRERRWEMVELKDRQQ